MAKSIAVALFTRDLRVHDNPVLTAAAEADTVIPLFVLDSAIAAYAVPNRAHFLAESLADLDASLRDLGAGLVVRRGRVVQEVRALPARRSTPPWCTSPRTSAATPSGAVRRWRQLCPRMAANSACTTR